MHLLQKASLSSGNHWATCQGFSPFISAKQPSPRVDQRSPLDKEAFLDTHSPPPSLSSSSSTRKRWRIETPSPNFQTHRRNLSSLRDTSIKTILHSLLKGGKQKRRNISFFRIERKDNDYFRIERENNIQSRL